MTILDTQILKEFDKEFDTSVVDEPLLKIQIDGLLLKAKSFLSSALSRVREEERKRVIGIIDRVIEGLN